MGVAIKKGRHYDYSIKQRLNRIIPRNTDKYFLRGYIEFGPEAEYELVKANGKPDKSRNKIGGINLYIWDESNVNSGMLCWWCDPDKGKCFSGYWNKNGENIYPENPRHVIPFGKKEKLMYEVEYTDNKMSVRLFAMVDGKWKMKSNGATEYNDVNVCAAEISSWFGGQRKAPKNIKYSHKTKWVKKSNQ